MYCRRQALEFCLYSVIIVVIQICNQFLSELFHRIKFLKIQEVTFEYPKEILHYCIIQTIAFEAHTLSDALLLKHLSVLLMLILPLGIFKLYTSSLTIVIMALPSS